MNTENDLDQEQVRLKGNDSLKTDAQLYAALSNMILFSNKKREKE